MESFSQLKTNWRQEHRNKKVFLDLGVCFYLQIWLCANGDSNPHLPPQHDAAETAKDLISLELPSQSASPPPDEDEAEVQAAEDGISTEEE